MISVVVSYILLILIKKISHNVKFFLILSILILSYVISKYFHLSALIIIFIFGLILSNSKQLLPGSLKEKIPSGISEKDFHDFHILTAEMTFLLRTFFFLFFGFNIVMGAFMDLNIYKYGLSILAILLFIRFLYFGFSQPKNILPIALIAPRGLISILLFLQIPTDFKNKYLDESTLLVVILGSMIFMLIGIIKFSEKKPANEETESEDINSTDYLESSKNE